MSENRDVRTLVLCKVNPSKNKEGRDYAGPYNKISTVINTEKQQSLQFQPFITLGGFDAMYVYKTEDTRVGNPGWLDSVLGDKQEIVGKINAEISYHPIHLVHNACQDGFWDTENDKFPFFFVTFLYGVQVLPHEILDFLQSCEYSHKKVHAIYRCINISDMVLFTKSDNIPDALKLLSKIELEGKAEQTYTTLSFPFDSTGAIADYVYDALQKASDEFCFILQGSIRKTTKWKALVDDAKESKIKVFTDNEITFCFGAQDFSISGQIDNQRLSELLKYLLNNSRLISSACWEIHTELGVETTSDEGDSTEHERLLADEYKYFLELVKKGNIQEYPWQFSFMELFATQVNIDNHPLLHGPSYLLSDCFRVVNKYFSCCGKDVPADIDIIEPKTLLWESQSEIERFIRCCNQLTDHLTRGDDVVFHGLGRIPAIASTLPESALEFYYYFLRKFADILISHDETCGRKPDDYEYSFLLAPGFSERMRIRPMFNTQLKYRKEKNQKLWPKKQVYIIQFLTDNIYKPADCFIPLIHECFHKFGDKFRFRAQRFWHMALFVSETFLSSVGLVRSNREDLLYAVAEELAKTADKADNMWEPYLDEAATILYSNLKALLTAAGLDRLYHKMGRPYYLYTEQNRRQWFGSEKNVDTQSELSGSLYAIASSYVKACVHLFRECYADIMTIVSLKITPEEYLLRFLEEYSRFSSAKSEKTLREMNAACQRNAIVLVAYCSKGDGKKGAERWDSTLVASCRDAIEKVFVNRNEGISKRMRLMLDSLIKGKTSSSEQLAEEPNQGHLSSGAMMFVVEYLSGCKQYLLDRASLFTGFREDFNNIIRCGGMFGERFYKIIDEGRDEVKERSKNA